MYRQNNNNTEPTPQGPNQMARIVTSSIAAIITGGLFLTMSGLIADEVILDDREPPIWVDVIYQIKEEPPKRAEIIVEKIPDPTPPPPTPDPQPPKLCDGDCYDVPTTPQPKPTPPNPRPNLNRADGDMIVLATFPARYPRRPASQGIEGYVIIGLTVNESGQVENPQVLESAPEGTFDRAAIAAITKFKYKPRIREGIAVPVYNVRYKMIFELED